MTLDTGLARGWNRGGSMRPAIGSCRGGDRAVRVRAMQQAELVQLARGGDERAFAELVARVSDRLYAIAWRIVRDADRAEDALQRTLISIWDDLPGLRDPARFDAWACRIVVRESVREAKRERQRVQVRDISPTGAHHGDPADDLAARDEIEHGFRRLTPEHRAILTLRYYLDLPIAEMAASLGVPEGTVHSRIHYALQSLRAALEAEARPMQAWRAAG
jgi:RNA polymerase sigma-70 factor (ECF subfamily)